MSDRVRVTLELAASVDEKSLIRLLRQLLKTLGRTYRVKCKGIRMTKGDEQ